jgi:hypothetical protein
LLFLLSGCTDDTSSTVSNKPTTGAVAAATDPLLFHTEEYSVETKTVSTASGDKKVTYHAYMHIPYVSNPVEVDYQSLNVSVPVEIDGVAVDASNAPILLANGVGGYMSFSNKTNGFGMPAGFFPGMDAAVNTGGQAAAQGPPGGAAPQGGMPGGMAPSGGMPGGTGGPGGAGGMSDMNNAVSGKQDLALAAGYVVVEPGCRGRDNQAEDGTYYGKAPAAIVDLKAAVRYIKHNKGILPGNVDWIVSSGCSAGGGLSSLLGASGNSPMYDAYLKEIGAADADDSIFACGAFSPITDLDHADMGYEWLQGDCPLASGELVDQTLSKKLIALFAEYQASLNLKGRDNFGTLTIDNYDEYMMQQYLIPSATRYLKGLSEDERSRYLAITPWLTWDGHQAVFDFRAYIASTDRVKGLPAFDDLEMAMPEPLLFGTETIDGRHFTDFTLQQVTGDPTAKIDSDLRKVVNMMNPMYFIGQKNSGCAKHWWIRAGSDESGLVVILGNMATGLENLDRDVDAGFFWDAGHCEDSDPESFIAWIGDITGYTVGK